MAGGKDGGDPRPPEPDGPDDRELMRRHAAGEPDAFAVIVARHRERLWAVALRTLRHPEDAADALQDALLSAYRAAGPGGSGFRGDASPSTWLHRIVVNACLDRARRAQVRRSEPLDDAMAGTLPDPADAVADVDRALVVAEALATLPVEQRAALVLVDMQGYSVEQAAAILECPVGTVKSRCARGRARLAPLLQDLAPGSGTDSATSDRNQPEVQRVRPREGERAPAARGTPPPSAPAGRSTT